MDKQNETLEKVVGRFKSKITHKRFHFSPDIPIAKLEKAINVFALGARGEAMLFFFDNSTLGDGRSGILITDAALYSSDGFSKVKIDIAKMTSASIQKFYGDKRLVVDNQPVNGPGLFGRKEFPMIAEMINDICRIYNPVAAAASGKGQSLTEQHPEKITAGISRDQSDQPTFKEIMIGRIVAFILLAIAGGILLVLTNFLFGLIFHKNDTYNVPSRIVLALILLSGLPSLSAKITTALMNVRKRSEDSGMEA